MMPNNKESLAKTTLKRSKIGASRECVLWSGVITHFITQKLDNNICSYMSVIQNGRCTKTYKNSVISRLGGQNQFIYEEI